MPNHPCPYFHALGYGGHCGAPLPVFVAKRMEDRRWVMTDCWERCEVYRLMIAKAREA